MILNEPSASYASNIIEPAPAALRFVQYTNRLSGGELNSAPLPASQIESAYCCGSHSREADRKWMEQFLCHLSGQASCPDWTTNQPVATPNLLRGTNGGYMRYLKSYHWHIYTGHSTAVGWSNTLNRIKGWIDTFHNQYQAIANLPVNVIITETGAPLEQYWQGDNIYDKINILFQRRLEPWLEGVMWTAGFVHDDIFGSGISTRSSLFNCPDCNVLFNEGHVRITNTGLYFRKCIRNNGVCPNPDTFVPPAEINASVGAVLVNGNFRTGTATSVSVPITHGGIGSWISSLKWRYYNPVTGATTQNQTCPATGCIIIPDSGHVGWQIIIRVNVQQTDPQNASLRHICSKGTSESGEWSIVHLPGLPQLGIPYDNPNSTCTNELSASFPVLP